MQKELKIGDIYFIQFPGTDHIQKGGRPGVITQNNKGNLHSPNVRAVPLSTNLNKKDYPMHVFLPSEDTPLPYDSIALCEDERPVPKECIGRYIGELPMEYCGAIGEAMQINTPMLMYLSNTERMKFFSKLLKSQKIYALA